MPDNPLPDRYLAYFTLTPEEPTRPGQRTPERRWQCYVCGKVILPHAAGAESHIRGHLARDKKAEEEP